MAAIPGFFEGDTFARNLTLPEGVALREPLDQPPADSPDELFLSKMQFTIYEGDWGQYYGARFEVWFDPTTGGKERKLPESNWKIEGWMH